MKRFLAVLMLCCCLLFVVPAAMAEPAEDLEENTADSLEQEPGESAGEGEEAAEGEDSGAETAPEEEHGPEEDDEELKKLEAEIRVNLDADYFQWKDDREDAEAEEPKHKEGTIQQKIKNLMGGYAHDDSGM